MASVKETEHEQKKSEDQRLDPALSAWFDHFKLRNYADALFEAGLDSFAEVTDAEEDDIKDWIDEAKLPKSKGRKLRNAIAAVKSGEYVSADEDMKTDAAPRDRVKYEPGFHNIQCKRVAFDARAMKGSQRVVSTGSNKIVMVVGQTGAGKTTFLNSMANYIYNVQFEDQFRLKLIIEQEKKGGQAVSQTDVVSAYFIKKPKGSRIPYDLTVVDTPGFGDTRGIGQDEKIVANIKDFFENVLDSIDAVCFVVKATETRLTGSQTYIFNSVLNLWGKDMKENIFILMTFADAEEPPVLDAIKKQGTVATCEWFKLNNSVYKKDPRKMSDNKQAQIFDRMFWDMGTMCFDSLFQGLNKVSTKSVAYSRQVLRERQLIQTKIQLMSQQLNVALEKQHQMDREREFIEEHRKDIDANKEVAFTKQVEYKEKVPSSNTLITTCMYCDQMTCHPDCGASNKAGCCMMNADGNCTVCGCHHSQHANCAFTWEPRWRDETRTNWSEGGLAKDRYKAAKSKVSESERLLRQMEQAKQQQETKVKGIIGFVTGCINKLEQIALRPAATTVGDYIDQLIATEKEAPGGGNKEKVKKLKDYKKIEKIIETIQKKGGDSVQIRDLMH